ncbi:MAG: hypothetical protein ACLTTU_12260 [Bilophila wadsworthia]
MRHEADHGHRHDRGLAGQGLSAAWAWRWRRAWNTRTTASTASSATASSRKNRSGKRPCAGAGLDNLVVLVDDNGMQINDYADAINAVRPLDKR